MILVPGKFLFLATPRTASRSLKEMVRQNCKDTKETLEHHVHPEDIFSEFPEARDVPIFTVVREPYDHALSWFYHAVVRNAPQRENTRDFLTFLRTMFISWYFSDRLNVYAEVATHFLPYQAGVVSAYETMTGHAFEGKAPVIGLRPRTKPVSKMLTPFTERAVRQRFPQDIELWQALLTE